MKAIAAVFVLCVWMTSPVTASIYTIEVGGAEFSNSGAKDIGDDALILTFDDGYGPDRVRVTIFFKGTGADATSKIKTLVFNFDDSLSITGWSHQGGDEADSIVYDPNDKNNKVDGSNYYDLMFEFPTSGDTFSIGDKSVYDFYGPGIVADSFDFLNDMENESDKIFLAGVHINAVDNGDSGQYGSTGSGVQPGSQIPEPATMLVWTGFGLGGLAAARYRKRRKQKQAAA